MNHTCIADIFLCDRVVECQQNFLAWRGTLLTIPFSILSSLVINSVWLTKLGMKKEEMPAYYDWLDNQFNWFWT